MSYTTKDLRNVAILGHGNTGKTSLVESMLYVTGAIDRQGKVSDGNTVCDYDAEEISRQITISTAVAPVTVGNNKINILDCPGYFDFAGDVLCALRAVEAGAIVVSAKDTAENVAVGAQRSWKYLRQAGLPVMFVISKCREEHGDFFKALETLRGKYGPSVCPVTIPTSDGTGVIDLVHNVAYVTNGNKTSKVAVPAADAGKAEDLRMELMESAAITEELMEKFLDTMELTDDEIAEGLREGLKTREVVPVFASDAMTNLGTSAILQGIVDYCPAPEEKTGAVTGFVFKTVSDKFGKFSFVKVVSGTITAAMTLRNLRASSNDKLGRLYTMCGKKSTEVQEACCGDIVAVGKMDWKTNDTVTDDKDAEELPAVAIPEPFYSVAIAPKTKGQDDKVAGGLAKLNEEDISFNLVNNAETRQMVLTGSGDIQVSVLCSKLKNLYNVETEQLPARVAYREKIKGKVEAHGRHKKQSGGSGQFGDVWIRFEPQEETDDLVFAEEVFGGSVPKNFFPSVEKGLRNAVQRGVLAGYPLVGLKATLYDGSYHPVDSNDMAFQTAARLAYQDGIPKARPTILEPIGQLFVTIPDEFQGAIIGDINSKRRGTMMGSMPAEDGMTTIEAEVPMAEMSTYTIDLRSMTQGAGSFTCKFVRYEEAPGNVQQKVIEEAKALAEAE
ncbi:MAG: elongation factor G [Oscillospiraceae bacterium]|nr:elongation factor G [Oscillospiraceae bacterium]